MKKKKLWSLHLKLITLKLMYSLATVEIHYCQIKIYVVIHKRHPAENGPHI